MVLNNPDRLNQLARIAQVFTPSRPVQDATVFAGREDQQERLTKAILEPGRHAIIYGARGVGKTSLVNVVGHSFTAEAGATPEATHFTIKIPCSRDDDFDVLWRRLLSNVSVTPFPGAETVVAHAALGAARPALDIGSSLLEAPDLLTPALVERTFRDSHRAVLVFDEFDVVDDEDCRREFAELLKMMSDAGTGPTVVLVGVGHDISALIGHHESVQRCTEQIEMPPMTADETTELVHTGFLLLGLEATEGAADTVVDLSRGFPAFAHSLCKQAAELVTERGATLVRDDDIYGGATRAIEQLEYSLGATYEQAVDPAGPGDLIEMTLAAAAWLPPGRFRPADVKHRQEEWGITITSPAIGSHLRRLATTSGGAVLIAHGETRPSYEFRDPMMIPYVAIRNIHRIPPE